MNEESPYVIPTYKRVWKIERTLVRLDRFKLPRPITIWQIIYFMVAFVVVLIIDKNTPLLSWLGGTLRYVFLPGAIAFYLSKVKHDGKAPHRFLLTIIKYELSPKILNRYKAAETAGKQKYEGVCTFRELYSK
ncbi:hypothetical protein AV654_19470 [Paenibacillus elgii]|uniref:Conjugal transfer protein n=1 Tax=Paenibacillus elgii TaxID=189691 RepID=A0A163XN17_9BACL|nr:TcpE family conjugal transfer membrane protein [Paenibacillus elgii]KZE78157.1 hypothetical protein AV654_19470 [Paenibacillus elgii]